MHLRASVWLGLIFAPALMAIPTPSYGGSFEDAVLAELNRVRAHPQAYARELRRQEITPARYDPGDPYAADDGGWDDDDPDAGSVPDDRDAGYGWRAAPDDRDPRYDTG